MQKPVLTKGYYVNTLLMRSFSLIKTDFPVLTLFLKQTAGTLEKNPEHFRALTKSSHCGPKYLNHPTLKKRLTSPPFRWFLPRSLCSQQGRRLVYIWCFAFNFLQSPNGMFLHAREGYLFDHTFYLKSKGLRLWSCTSKTIANVGGSDVKDAKGAPILVS